MTPLPSYVLHLRSLRDIIVNWDYGAGHIIHIINNISMAKSYKGL